MQYVCVAEHNAWDSSLLLHGYHGMVTDTYPAQLATNNPMRLTCLERTFKCAACGRDYHWKQSLQLHLRHECGKDPQFQCPYCPQRTTRMGSLKRHIKNKHPGRL